MPAKKRLLALTVDHEIYGNGTGDVRQHVTGPAERMARIAEKYGVPMTVFFELEEYLQFERNSKELKQHLGYDPALEMREQAANLSKRGHDIQLHLHPQWHGACFDNGQWKLHQNRLTVDSLFENQSDTNSFLRERKQALEDITGRETNVYRAGGFAAQPGHRLLKGMAETGFRLGSSVVKGMARKQPHPLDFRDAPANRRAWRVREEVTKEAPDGPIWEIPVHSKMGRRFNQLGVNRLKAKFSRNVPKTQKQELLGQLGVRRKPLSLLSFLFRPVPIKLDYHNLSPAALLRMIRSAPAPVPGDLDALVLIGHTKEHVRDRPFEEFLRRATKDPTLEFVSMRQLAEMLTRN